MLEQYRGNESILLVDDEPTVLTLARAILNRCGYTVHGFEDPQEALESNRKIQVDLVLTDVVMPKISGPDLVKRIKAEHPKIPCIFMSGYDLNQIAARGIETGCAYLRKPFTPESLVKKVRSALADNEDSENLNPEKKHPEKEHPKKAN